MCYNVAPPPVWFGWGIKSGINMLTSLEFQIVIETTTELGMEGTHTHTQRVLTA